MVVVCSAKQREPPFEFLIKRVQGILQTIHTIVIALGCFSELEDKTLLLKTPHTSNIELGGIKLGLILEALPWVLALIVPEGGTKATSVFFSSSIHLSVNFTVSLFLAAE